MGELQAHRNLQDHADAQRSPGVCNQSCGYVLSRNQKFNNSCNKDGNTKANKAASARSNATAEVCTCTPSYSKLESRKAHHKLPAHSRSALMFAREGTQAHVWSGQ